MDSEIETLLVAASVFVLLSSSYRILVISQADGQGGRSDTERVGLSGVPVFVSICFVCDFSAHAIAPPIARVRSIGSSHSSNT